MKKLLLLVAIWLVTPVCVAVGTLLLDSFELDFSLAGHIRYALGIEKPDPDKVFVMAYELLLYASAVLMTLLIGRQIHAAYLAGRGTLTEVYRLWTRRIQVLLGGLSALLLLGASGLLAIREGVWIALVPGAALAVRWVVYMWKGRK